MNKRLSLKNILLGVGLAGIFLVGYFAASVATSCRADAFICCAGLGQAMCIGVATGTGPAIAVLDATVVATGIAWAGTSVGAYYIVSLGQFGIKVLLKIGNVINNWVGWWDTFWFYNMNPALQDMAKQLQVLDAAQARAIGGFKDAMALNKAAAARRKQEIKTRSEVSPGENVCSTGSLAGGMTRAQVLTSAYNAASSNDQLVRMGGAVGTPAAAGRSADMASRYQTYCTTYADPGDNAGNPGCPAAAAIAPEDRDADLDVPGRIFARGTIPVKDPHQKQIVDDMLRNIAGPFVADSISPDRFTTAEGQETVLKNEREKALRQVAYGALYHPVSRRVPGTGDTTTGANLAVEEVSTAAGVTRDTDQSPSMHEAMEALLMKNRTGDYAVRQIDEPNNAEREAAIQAGVRTRQLADLLDLLDRMSLVVAGQVGNQVAAEREASGIDSAVR